MINAETVLIEPTSGNTGIALAFVAASAWLPLKLVMPESSRSSAHRCWRSSAPRSCVTPAAQGMKGAIATAEG